MIKLRTGQVWGKIMFDSYFDLHTITRLSDSRVYYTKPCGAFGWLNRSKFVEDYEMIPKKKPHHRLTGGEWVKQ